MKGLIQLSGVRIRHLAGNPMEGFRRRRSLCSGFFDSLLGRTAKNKSYHIPDHIERPDYAEDGCPKGVPPVFPWIIYQNTPEEMECAREAGRISREVLDAAGKAVQAGVSTAEIDEVVYAETIKRGAYPSPLNYRGFPKCVCTSLNEVVCHGIPDTNRKFVNGDIVNIDVSCYIRGYHGDNSEMFCVGEVDDDAKKLLKVTYDSWQAAIAICRPGVPYNKIGQNYTLDDGWTTVTSDNKRSAQFEHTLLITETGRKRIGRNKEGGLLTCFKVWRY
eukprot:766144-Hanusia_phi.AAC.2